MPRKHTDTSLDNPAFYNDNNSYSSSFDPVKTIPSSEDGSEGSEGSERSRRMQRLCQFKDFFLLPLLLLLAMVTGIGVGFGIRKADPEFTKDPRRIMYLTYPGELLLRMLKICIIPLIVSSLIAGMASLPAKAAGKLGIKTIAYYLSTTFMAVLLGILLVCTIKPGQKGMDISDPVSKKSLVHPIDALLDLIRNIFPPNLIEACFEQTSTAYNTKPYVVNKTEYNRTSGEYYYVNQTKERIVDFRLVSGGGTNVLGIVVFSIVFGLMVGRLGQQGKILLAFFDAIQQVIIRIVRLIIWYSPIGVMFLLASRIVSMDDPEKRFKQLGWYMLTVIIGLCIHAFISLPTIYAICTRKNPFKLMLHMSQALLTALGTASSSATLPITMRNLEENAKVHPRVSGFMIPVGATINMDGTALYEAVASIFIAQYNHIPLSAGQVVTVSITATAAAIGAAGVPEAGLVTMLIVLTAVGLPTEDVALIYAVDWFLDRLRTAVNVWGDCIGAGCVDATSQKDLAELDELERKEKEKYNSNGVYAHLQGNDMSVSKL